MEVFKVAKSAEVNALFFDEDGEDKNLVEQLNHLGSHRLETKLSKPRMTPCSVRSGLWLWRPPSTSPGRPVRRGQWRRPVPGAPVLLSLPGQDSDPADAADHLSGKTEGAGGRVRGGRDGGGGKDDRGGGSRGGGGSPATGGGGVRRKLR